MTAVVVSEMHETDIDSVLVLEKFSSATRVTAQTVISEMSNPMFIHFVAKDYLDTKRIVGFCVGQIISDELHIHDLIVDPDFRRQGIAQRLVDELFVIARGSGVKRATLEVRKSNVGAIELYRKFGFVDEGLRRNYYVDNGEDALIMWCYYMEGK